MINSPVPPEAIAMPDPFCVAVASIVSIMRVISSEGSAIVAKNVV